MKLFKKIKNWRRLGWRFVQHCRNSKVYPLLYKSWWHYRFSTCRDKGEDHLQPALTQYFSARPHPGAGIGHQIANWIAGYWFAKEFGLNFAHVPFSDPRWEEFLGFGEGEKKAEDLRRKDGYKIVYLPLFDENKLEQMNLVREIIKSYRGRKIIFMAEQDQFYADQYGVMDDLKRKFYSAKSRLPDDLIYSKTNYNIALHIRRGDIVAGQTNGNGNLEMRWLNNRYYTNILDNVIRELKTDKPVHIYLFSQGEEGDFAEFSKYDNVHFCLDMNPMGSFSHMVYADMLITSRSSFSYKPALISNGIKICPGNFWHGYPDSPDWILADENGQFYSKLNLKP